MSPAPRLRCLHKAWNVALDSGTLVPLPPPPPLLFCSINSWAPRGTLQIRLLLSPGCAVSCGQDTVQFWRGSGQQMVARRYSGHLLAYHVLQAAVIITSRPPRLAPQLLLQCDIRSSPSPCVRFRFLSVQAVLSLTRANSGLVTCDCLSAPMNKMYLQDGGPDESPHLWRTLICGLFSADFSSF